MTAHSILVLAPHTDDGELGCGASISRFIEAGHRVVYVAFSLCNDSLPKGFAPGTLEAEIKEAASILGIRQENLILFDHPVRKFNEQRQAILEELIGLQQQYTPSKVFIPSSTDIHQDHQVIHEEALRAFKHCSIFGYEMSWNNYQFSGNCFIKIDAHHLDKKISALSAYTSQQHRSYMQPDFIRSLATVRGVQAGSTLAECFEAMRIIE